MVLKCKEFRSGLIKGVDTAINLFLSKNRINNVVSVNYSSSATGTYALVFYKTR